MEMIQFLFIKRKIIFNKISNLLSRRVMTIMVEKTKHWN